MDKITEKTLIPIGAVSLIFGATMWLTSIWRQGDANASEIAQVRSDAHQDVQDLKEMHLRAMDKIGQKLDKINDKLDALAARKN